MSEQIEKPKKIKVGGGGGKAFLFFAGMGLIALSFASGAIVAVGLMISGAVFFVGAFLIERLQEIERAIKASVLLLLVLFAVPCYAQDDNDEADPLAPYTSGFIGAEWKGAVKMKFNSCRWKFGHPPTLQTKYTSKVENDGSTPTWQLLLMSSNLFGKKIEGYHESEAPEKFYFDFYPGWVELASGRICKWYRYLEFKLPSHDSKTIGHTITETIKCEGAPYCKTVYKGTLRAKR